MVRYLVAGLLLACAARANAFDVQVTIRKVDLVNARLVFTGPDGRERSAKFSEKAKFLDAEGKMLSDGLKSTLLKEGVKLSLSIVAEGNRPVIQALRIGGRSPQPVQKAKPLPILDTSALIALSDLEPNEKYEGSAGGLYPGVNNIRPKNHEDAGLALAEKILPLDGNGKPADDGKIVVLTIGFSNTSQSSQGFIEACRGDKSIDPRIVIVNGAQGGRSAFMVKDVDDGSFGTAYWKEWVPERLSSAGVNAAQVQAIWLKQTEAGLGPGQLKAMGVEKYDAPTRLPFPLSAKSLHEDLRKIVQILPSQFPNLRLTYVSSRSYGGWALREGNREPFSYETGFAVKWLIEEQLRGESHLNFDLSKGEVKAPWLSWGPYIWANGDTPRKDGFVFELDDFRENDRMHHSAKGIKKIGEELVKFFKTDPTTSGWFLDSKNPSAR